MFYLTILCTLCLLCISILLRFFFFGEQDGNQMVVYFQYLVVLMV